MSAYTTIDRETFKWVKAEVEATLQQARDELDKYSTTDDKETLYSLTNLLHQVVGSLQMLELKSLSTLIMECELMVEDVTAFDTSVGKDSFIKLVESAIAALQSSLQKMEQGLPENPIQEVELINQIRATRGLDAVEISSFFSPSIDVFPEVQARKALHDKDYRARAAALRSRFQIFLLQWLRDEDENAINRIRLIAEKLLAMSAFGAVARLWWVATGYIDYVRENELQNRGVHGRILRSIDDLLRQLVKHGESALVRNSGDELVNIMLFYAGVGEVRTERMDELARAFKLHEYFPVLQGLSERVGHAAIQEQLQELSQATDLPLPFIRQLVTSYFEEDQEDSSALLKIVEQMEIVSEAFGSADIELVTPVVAETLELVRGLRNGSIESSEDVGFHLAAAIMFIENSVNASGLVDEQWEQNGQLKYRALQAINKHEPLTAEMDGSQLMGSERKALLDVVGAEIEENLKKVEAGLESYSKEPGNPELLTGIDTQIRQVRGALQVLGEHKAGLLLQMSGNQFTALMTGKIEATPVLIDALAVSVGTMEEYVNGLQTGRQDMDYLLDRSISDLEIAIGKKVSRADVEALLDQSSDSLFSWLAEQSDFALFTDLKSNLRDLLTLARKTGLRDVEELVKEQNRLVDVVSQEPAFLNDNITASLQHNMANIAAQLIQLYGTEETAEELESDAAMAYKKSAIQGDKDDLKFHDDMDLEELGDEIAEDQIEQIGATEKGKQHAQDHRQDPQIDDAIFDVFVEESETLLGQARESLALCQTDANSPEAVRDLRRSFHTIKGSARMVGLEKLGELAWYGESVFNYVLDTQKQLTTPIVEFAAGALDELASQLSEKYENQHLIDAASWGAKAEKVLLEAESSESESTQPEDQTNVDEAGSGQSGSSADRLIDDARMPSASETGESKSATDAASQIEPPSAEDEIEFDSVSFSVIDDQEMRDVFVQEANANLGIMTAQLASDPLTVTEEDPLSIAIHTLLGNARTLGLDEISGAYERAESLSLQKLESGEALDPAERGAFNNLLSLTSECVLGVQQKPPYFPLDTVKWEQINTELRALVDRGTLSGDMPADVDPIIGENDEFDPQDTVIEMEFDETLFTGDFLESDNEPEEELEIELDHDEEDLIVPVANTTAGEDASIARVAAVFGGLEPIDDLLGGDQTSIADDQNLSRESAEDELAGLEHSLESMRGERKDTDTAEVPGQLGADDPLSADIESPLATVPDSRQTAVDDEQQESLIPDELTDLVESDLLAMELGIQSTDDAMSATQDQLSGSSDGQELDPATPIKEQSASGGAEPSMPQSGGEDRDLQVDQQEDESQDDLERPSFIEEYQASDVDENEEISEELRKLFLEELKSQHVDLDTEVAKLVDLQQTAGAMANIMRGLHTIKGNSLMAEANDLSRLTHQVESYLAGNFIHNEDELREVRKTLELYVDTIDGASDAYQSDSAFLVPPPLLQRLGVETAASPSTVETAIVVSAKPVEDDDSQIGDLEVNETLTAADDQIQVIMRSWKSARQWSKTQPQLLAQCQALELLTVDADELAPLQSFVTTTCNYVESLKLKKVAEFKYSKALLEEAVDLTIANAKALMGSGMLEDLSELQSKMSPAPGKRVNATAAETDAVVENLEGADSTGQSTIYLPAASLPTGLEPTEFERREKGAQKRASALRIRTDTLDSLTNFVGDASMNRAQMREDVLSIKGVVEGLYNNVQRFGNQIRELEIEADSKISSRSNESVSKDRGEEFDPLEMDRYTKLQQLSRGLAENLDELGDIQTSLSNFVYRAETSLQKQDRLNRELQDEIMQVRLVSFGGIGPQLRQVVRKTARELKKEVELELIGNEVRLDKSILDGVVPALEHMLRNAVDHGIEKPSVRLKKKKPKIGKIVVECRQVSREIIIHIRDDGAGLDHEKIRAKAIADNLLAEDQPLNPEELLMYISRSGFTTASKLTQVSGRGVGMDVVQTTLRRMSGSVAYDQEYKEAGTSFIIRLPISLAVSSAVFVRSGGEQFAIAARTIERVININAEQLCEYLKADKPSLQADGQSYLLIDLADYLGYVSGLADFSQKMAVILVNSGVQNIAVIVEELMDTQEIVIKNIGDHLGRIPIYAGATIRADGNVVLLIDLVGISYYESFVAPPESSAAITQSIPTVMVVDDSLTVRKSAERDIAALGINAVLAKDGKDAQSQLLNSVPDLILLDIEMPVMDGFEFLEWLKQEQSLKHIPVVMISSRATEKHINKATKLGCAGFLGKPYLLENLVTVFNQFLPLDTPIVLDKDR